MNKNTGVSLPPQGVGDNDDFPVFVFSFETNRNEYLTTDYYLGFHGLFGAEIRVIIGRNMLTLFRSVYISPTTTIVKAHSRAKRVQEGPAG